MSYTLVLYIIQRVNIFVEHFWRDYLSSRCRFEKIKKEVRIIPSNVSYDVLHHLSRFIQYKRYSIRFQTWWQNSIFRSKNFSCSSIFIFYFFHPPKSIRDILIKFSTDTDDQNLLNKLLYSTVSRDCILHWSIRAL